jgi:hypothetical protein
MNTWVIAENCTDPRHVHARERSNHVHKHEVRDDVFTSIWLLNDLSAIKIIPESH